MRFDDHRGMRPYKMRLVGGSLRATLLRTKVSGPDKKVEARPVHVTAEAYCEHPDWLRIGHDLWSKFADERDFFLTLPNTPTRPRFRRMTRTVGRPTTTS